LGSTTIGVLFTAKTTIIRLRGSAFVSLDPGAIADSMFVALGMIVVKADAFSTGGATSMPDPMNDFQAPWLYHKIFSLGPSLAATPAADEIGANQRDEIDVKAMRKVDPEDALAFIWNGQILAGSPTFDGQAIARLLVLLT